MGLSGLQAGRRYYPLLKPVRARAASGTAGKGIHNSALNAERWRRNLFHVGRCDVCGERGVARKREMLFPALLKGDWEASLSPETTVPPSSCCSSAFRTANVMRMTACMSSAEEHRPSRRCMQNCICNDQLNSLSMGLHRQSAGSPHQFGPKIGLALQIRGHPHETPQRRFVHESA
jgi:hypothetical protein